MRSQSTFVFITVFSLSIATLPTESIAMTGTHRLAGGKNKLSTLDSSRLGGSRGRGPASNSIWKMSTDSAVLKQTFHPLKGEGVTKMLYTCEGVARASSIDGAVSVMPRVVFRGPGDSAVWICATEHGTQVKPGVVHVLGNVTVFLKVGDRAAQKLITQTGELAHPVDVEMTATDVRVVDNYVIRHGTKIASWRPMTQVNVSCDSSTCQAAKPKCVLALQKKDDRQIVAHFDKAVEKYKAGRKKSAMELSEPFQLLDEVLLAAASGDKKAVDRLQNFPIQPEGGAIELVGSYVDQLDRLKSLGCFEGQAGHREL